MREGKMMGKIFGVALVCLMIGSIFDGLPAIVSSVAADEGYSYDTIYFPGAWHTEAYGINDAGQTVGRYDDDWETHGFLLKDGTFSTIDFPSAEWTRAHGINDAGHIVGDYYDDDWESHGFLFKDGNFSTIDFPGAPETWARGINNDDQIVGEYFYLGSHGFLFQDDSFSTIDFPGADSTRAYGINDAGQIVGRYDDDSEIHGFLFKDGNFSTIDFPGADSTWAYGINDAGQTVGKYHDDSEIHGFLFEDGNFSTIDFPGADSTWACGINDACQIVGGYDYGGYHGFIATRDSDWSFAFITDPHIGKGESEEHLTETINLINNMTNIEFVVIGGDLTNRGLESEFNTAHQILEGLDPAWIPIIGNHDVWEDPATGLTIQDDSNFYDTFGGQFGNFSGAVQNWTFTPPPNRVVLVLF